MGDAAAAAAVAPALPSITVWYRRLSETKFHVRAANAAAFLQQHPQLLRARLKVLTTSVKDSGDAPYLVVSPRPGTAVARLRPSGTKRRRADDCKELTALGLAAAKRERPDHAVPGGRITRDSVLWRMLYGCCGDAQCTPPAGRSDGCALLVECTATGRLILDGDLVQIELFNAHRADGGWDPPSLAPDPAKQAALTQALTEVEQLRVERAASAGAAGAAAARPLAAIDADLLTKTAEAKRLRLEVRVKHPPEVRDEIRQLTADGHGASMTQMLLDGRMRDRGLELPTPTVKYIQGVQDDSRRVWRGQLGPYDSARRLNELLSRPPNFRCIAYQEADPDAVDEIGRPQEERERTMWFSVYSTPELIEQAIGATHACLDAKWGTCSCGHPTIGLMAGKARTVPKPGEGPIPEMVGGMVHYDMHLACLGLMNKDNYFSPRIMFTAMRRMMPCSDPACEHRVVRKDRADGRGFHLERDCSGPQRAFSPLTTIDKAAPTARGLRSIGVPFVLCAFHVFAAMLEWYTGQGIRSSAVLTSLHACTKDLARSRSLVELRARWARLKAQVLPHIGLTIVQLAKTIAYLEQHWLDETDLWCKAWTDILRAELGLLWALTTNNFIERFWLVLVAIGCRHFRYNRVDDEVNGYTNVFGNLNFCLLDSLNLKLRDFPQIPTRVPPDWRRCFQRACLIVLQDGVRSAAAADTPAGSPLHSIMIVRRGLSNPGDLAFGSHRVDNSEFHVPRSTAAALKPIFASLRARFEAAGVQRNLGDGVCVCCLSTGPAELRISCECEKFLNDGPGRGGPDKHLIAGKIVSSFGTLDQARAYAQVTFLKQMRDRELRVNREDQVEAVARGTDEQSLAWILRHRATHTARRAGAALPQDPCTCAACARTAGTAAGTDGAPFLSTMERVEMAPLPSAEEESREEDGGSGAAKPGRRAAKKRRPMVKPPMTSYLHFCAAKRPDYAHLPFVERGRALGVAWRATTERQRAPFVALAEASREEHKAAVEAAQKAIADRAAVAPPEAAASGASPPGPRAAIVPGANGRRQYRGKDAARPPTGLKQARGPRGGGGRGKRISTDASHAGRTSRVSKAFERERRELEGLKRRRKSLHEKAAMEAEGGESGDSCEPDTPSLTAWMGAAVSTASSVVTNAVGAVAAWPLQLGASVRGGSGGTAVD